VSAERLLAVHQRFGSSRVVDGNATADDGMTSFQLQDDSSHWHTEGNVQLLPVTLWLHAMAAGALCLKIGSPYSLCLLVSVHGCSAVH
jgi:hypothetical protein